MNEKDTKTTTDHAAPPSGEDLSEKERRQLENQGLAEHEQGPKRERLIEEAEEVEDERDRD